MTARFFDPAYLAGGNERQRAAFDVLKELRMFETLKPYNPMLCGTIPLAIDIPESDLDMLCEVHDFERFATVLEGAHGSAPDFILSDRTNDYRTASFSHGGFTVEVFGQARPVTRQRAYRHMVIQARLLELGGETLRGEILAWRAGGLKTEPAFARRLAIAGDPYVALLALEDLDDDGLRRLLDDTAEAHCG